MAAARIARSWSVAGAAALVVLMSVGCASRGGGSMVTGGEHDMMPGFLASLTKPDPALLPLAMLEGTWARVLPNGTMQEETWTAVRGQNASAMFRQLRPDGRIGFHEISAVDKQSDGVFLRLRHLHAQLVVPETEPVPGVFRLAESGPGMIRWEGVSQTRGVSGVTYRLAGKEVKRIDVEVRFEDAAKKAETYSLTKIR